jgi:hypothetical protein
MHLAVVVWVAGCAAATYWQVGRAFQGNEFSYLYSFEWPVFLVGGIYGWWAIVHTDPESSLRRAKVRDVKEADDAVAHLALRDRTSEDAELAAYNDHLAQLAASGKRKGWRV